MLSRFSRVRLFATHQALLSMEFSRQEYWDELPEDFPNPGIKPTSLMSPALAPPGKPKHWTSGDKGQWSLRGRKQNSSYGLTPPCPSFSLLKPQGVYVHLSHSVGSLPPPALAPALPYPFSFLPFRSSFFRLSLSLLTPGLGHIPQRSTLRTVFFCSSAPHLLQNII